MRRYECPCSVDGTVHELNSRIQPSQGAGAQPRRTCLWYRVSGGLNVMALLNMTRMSSANASQVLYAPSACRPRIVVKSIGRLMAAL